MIQYISSVYQSFHYKLNKKKNHINTKKVSYSGKRIKKVATKKREAMKNEFSGDLIGIVSFLLIVYLGCDDQQHAFSQQSLNSKAERSTAKLARV